MDHQRAISGLYAERYLLGELGDGERAEYEAHFFECDQCAAAVASGKEFIDALRATRGGQA